MGVCVYFFFLWFAIGHFIFLLSALQMEVVLGGQGIRKGSTVMDLEDDIDLNTSRSCGEESHR